MKEINRAVAVVVTAGYMLYAAGCANNLSDSITDTQNGEEHTVSYSDDAQSTDGESISDITEGLVYDEGDNTWSKTDEYMQKFVKIMKSECAKSPDIKDTYLLASGNEVLFIGGINSTRTDGSKTDAYTVHEIGSVTKTFYCNGCSA